MKKKNDYTTIDLEKLKYYYFDEYLSIDEIILKFDSLYSKFQIFKILKLNNWKRPKKGNPNYKHSLEQKAKRETTNIERYGCKNPMQNSSIKQKSIDRRVEIYGED